MRRTYLAKEFLHCALVVRFRVVGDVEAAFPGDVDFEFDAVHALLVLGAGRKNALLRTHHKRQDEMSSRSAVHHATGAIFTLSMNSICAYVRPSSSLSKSSRTAPHCMHDRPNSASNARRRLDWKPLTHVAKEFSHVFLTDAPIADGKHGRVLPISAMFESSASRTATQHTSKRRTYRRGSSVDVLVAGAAEVDASVVGSAMRTFFAGVEVDSPVGGLRSRFRSFSVPAPVASAVAEAIKVSASGARVEPD